MTIDRKIIFSSTLVAFLAALAAFMGWKNTQPIQEELVQKLTHTTEEIRFLEEIKNDLNDIKSEILEAVKYPNEAAALEVERYFEKGTLLKPRVERLKDQIESFDDFNRTLESERAIAQMLELCESLSAQLRMLFPINNSLPEKSIAFKSRAAASEVSNELKAILVESNHLRFLIIKEEGKKIKTQISKLNFWILLIGGLTFLMAIVFGRIIANNLSSEFQKLRHAANQINKGDYSARVGIKSNDEFGNLGKTFDGMAANLEQSKIIEDQKLAMEQLNEDLKIKNDLLDRFVYRVSHDLKAPVLNITSLLKLLKLKIGNNVSSETTQIFFFLEKSVNKLQQTIFDLLEVSRIERSLKNTEEWINLEQVLSRIKMENSAKILNSDVKITCEFGIPEIFFSPTNLESVLSNLITNAIKYSSTQRRPEIHLKTERKEDFICLSITDNGLGIDLDKHESKLFGMFNRFHSHVEGSGVGLYIVKKAMEDAGGHIEVESEVGEGTTFNLFFKRAEIPVL